MFAVLSSAVLLFGSEAHALGYVWKRTTTTKTESTTIKTESTTTETFSSGEPVGPGRRPRGDQVMTHTKQGPIIGNVYKGAIYYQNIPYAHQPERWKPVRHDYPTWEKPLRSNLTDIRSCVQMVGMTTTVPGWAPISRQSEDCHYVNVWAPIPEERKTRSLLPVMVWIYGGGLQNGAGYQYPGNLYAQRGIISVNMNYRLGAFGYVPTNETGLEGGTNGGYNGLLDQVQALRWVRDNIAAYGGDPDQVTIAGESAGGWSTCLHLLSPVSKGLFKRVAVESGTCVLPWYPPPHKKDQTTQFFKALGTTTLEEARKLDWEKVVVANRESGSYFSGTLDGYFMPEAPNDLFYKGDFNVDSMEDLMTGVTTMDSVMNPIYTNALQHKTVTNLDEVLTMFFGEKVAGKLQAVVEPFENDMQKLVFIQAQAMQVCDSHRVASTVLKGSHFYMFGDVPTTNINPATPNTLWNEHPASGRFVDPRTNLSVGLAPHGTDVPTTWSDMFNSTERTLFQTPLHRRLSERMTNLWTAFVKEGGSGLDRLGWPATTNSTDSKFMYFDSMDDSSPVRKKLAFDVCDLINSVDLATRYGFVWGVWGTAKLEAFP